MIVAHIGPPTGRIGGPAGYLHELRRAAGGAESRHSVLFPAITGPATPVAPESHRVPSLVRAALRRVKRLIRPGPKFYRPSEADFLAEDGVLQGMMLDLQKTVLADAQASVEAAERKKADVLFHHDPFTAADHLQNHRRGSSWLFAHAPFPLVLYHAWCFGTPEKDWREFLAYPDVQRWIGWEASVWNRVDRLLLPCREAGEEFVRVDPRFEASLRRAEYLPTGAGRPRASADRTRDELRQGFGFKAGEVVGLFLGNNQPYRGMDLLIEAIRLLPASPGTGVIAVAGPPKELLPAHPRLRALGRVNAIGDLLEAVDFVVNVNRFSLFDLSTIEALAAGKPLLLSAIGGNRTFHALGAGAMLLDDLAPTTIAAGLLKFFQMSKQERKGLERASLECHNRTLGLPDFWQRHLELYDKAEKELIPA